MNDEWGDRSRMGVHKFLPSSEVVPPDLQAHLSNVLACAASGLQANVAIFLDVDGKCVHPWARVYAMTSIGPVDDCWATTFDAAVDEAFNRYSVPFVVRIWISQRVLARESALSFITGALAHELDHARQYDAAPDLYLAWEPYDRFLQEMNCRLPHWHKPLEIGAELAAREVVRQLLGAEATEELRQYYPEVDYEQVLGQEKVGNFDAGKYFRDMIMRGDPDFLRWQRGDPDARDNSWLREVAGELRSKGC